MAHHPALAARLRSVSRALAAVALVAALAACGGGGVGGSGEVRFLVFGEPEEIRAYRDVVAAFEREEEDVSVQLVEAADRDDLLTRSRPRSRVESRRTSS
jgi:multiple sugar transport system substrate-binding protein